MAAFQTSNAVATTHLVNGCFAVECDKCGKTTWSGCGRHVESVMASVPKDQQCFCPR